MAGPMRAVKKENMVIVLADWNGYEISGGMVL